MTKLQTKILLFAGLASMAFLPAAQASEWNQKTVLTFSGPVEIPGQVLPAGTYVFKLADSLSNRHIVQVFSQDEKRVFGTFLAIPDYHMHPSEETIIKFAERPAGSPVAIKAWFYPGRNYGHEFVYPKKEAVALAKANDTPVPFIPESVKMTKPQLLIMDLSLLKVEEPSGKEVEVAEEFPVESIQDEDSTPEPEMPAELPKTGSTLPLIGLIGLMSLGTAATLRLVRTK
jgi:LPXTG-motif cell wall-anchored protein